MCVILHVAFGATALKNEFCCGNKAAYQCGCHTAMLKVMAAERTSPIYSNDNNEVAQFTQDAEHLATHAYRLWNTMWSMGVFTQVASNIKGFARKLACKCAFTSCVNEP